MLPGSEVEGSVSYCDLRMHGKTPGLEAVKSPVTLHFGGREIVSTATALRYRDIGGAETYFLPRPAFRHVILRPVTGSAFCEVRGRIRYFDMALGRHLAQRAAWEFPVPRPGFEALRGHLAVCSHVLDSAEIGGLPVALLHCPEECGWEQAGMANPGHDRGRPLTG